MTEELAVLGKCIDNNVNIKPWYCGQDAKQSCMSSKCKQLATSWYVLEIAHLCYDWIAYVPLTKADEKLGGENMTDPCVAPRVTRIFIHIELNENS